MNNGPAASATLKCHCLMRSLHRVHNLNAWWGCHGCPRVPMFILHNHFRDFD